jgi:dTDP-4-dehydrorhamnose reductase
MRVLILGATGMLGQALMREASKRAFQAKGAARRGTDFSIDITDDQALIDVIKNIRPEIIINSAAIVNHANCEKDPGLAYSVNARPVSVLAESAIKTGAYLVQISTDHYYTGDSDFRHSESSPVRLINEYARTKFAGEIFALTCPGALVVRTNIVGFRYKKEQPSFAEWVIQTLKEGSPMKMFDDFFTSSIHVAQLSIALFDALKKRPCGILNLASRDVSSKKTFIEAVASRMGWSLANASVGSVKELPGAPRAESLGLDVAKAEKLLGYQLPTLNEVIESLMNEYEEKLK